MHPNGHSSPIYNSQVPEATEVPSVNEWIKKLWYIYTMEYYTAERKKELRAFATSWMDLESIILSVISQVVKDKCHIISFISGT